MNEGHSLFVTSCCKFDKSEVGVTTSSTQTQDDDHEGETDSDGAEPEGGGGAVWRPLGHLTRSFTRSRSSIRQKPGIVYTRIHCFRFMKRLWLFTIVDFIFIMNMQLEIFIYTYCDPQEPSVFQKTHLEHNRRLLPKIGPVM